MANIKWSVCVGHRVSREHDIYYYISRKIRSGLFTIFIDNEQKQQFQHQVCFSVRIVVMSVPTLMTYALIFSCLHVCISFCEELGLKVMYSAFCV